MAEMQAPGDGQAPGEAPEKPDGEAPSGKAPEKPDGESTDGEAPEKPDGEAPSGETPAKPDGDSSDSQAPSDNGNGNSGVPNGAPDGQGQAPSMFTASGEAITFTLTDDTQITVEQGSETTDGTVDDIKEGSILELTWTPDNNALTVVVKNAGGRVREVTTARPGQ